MHTLYLLLTRSEDDNAIRLRLGGGHHTNSTQPARIFDTREEAEEGLRYAAPFVSRDGVKWVPEVVEVHVP